jgi:lipopolysaccharide/colanic/teichoic acid biosynthesis glycosyltransferase
MLVEFLALRKLVGSNGKHNGHAPAASGDGETVPFSQALFAKLLCLERKRAERSRRPFALMLLDAHALLGTDRDQLVCDRLAAALSESTRETDICGWYTAGSVLGVIFTEIGSPDTNAVRTQIVSKVQAALQIHLGSADAKAIRVSLHLFPEDAGPRNGTAADSTLRLYPDLDPANGRQRAARIIKRAIDIVGSLLILLLLSPVLLAVALAIKLTSPGPILFRQQRIGQFGVPFTFLKFRSMYAQSDARVHQEYVRRFIAGQEGCLQSDGNGGAYKLQDDPRVTPVGKFLRRTSLDEFPQFLNVLRGDMSLVGPRPPIPYEIEVYDLWHRRRFLEALPGITGLWQVTGRSKCKFDEMVRLDIKYVREWSLALDLKILLATPRAVLFGKGAY